jgi:phosphoadenosine phosphosulfate reductase
VQKHYGLKLKFYTRSHERSKAFVREQGINGFYDSVELRKACCFARKVEPLQRALAGKKAWITGMRAAAIGHPHGTCRCKRLRRGNGLEKFNPLSDWTEKEVWAYIRSNKVPYNALHDKFYPSIGCAPCTRPVTIPAKTSAPAAGGGKTPNPRNAACTSRSLTGTEEPFNE